MDFFTARIFLVILANFLLLDFGILGSFPPNKKPINDISTEDMESAWFLGGEATTDKLSSVQDAKVMTIAGKEVLTVLARNNLFVINRDNISPLAEGNIPHTDVFIWNTDTGLQDMCIMKGQSKENCENYLRVLETIDEDGEKFVVCATNSYNPMCKYLHAEQKSMGVWLRPDNEEISGKEKCAFGPDQTGVSLYTDGALYSATSTEYNGRSFTITRNLGDVKQLRTPKFDTNFLKEPQFVKMMDDGDRVLIFMNEVERLENGEIRMAAFVAQVCKNDVGGHYVLAKQWTKFLKTRMDCSNNGFYFDQLQGVSDPVDVRVGPGVNNTEKVIYATFTTPDFSVTGSAVCSFTLDSIHDALRGRFKEDRTSGTSDAPTGEMHPGNCPTEKFTQSQLQFLKGHPLLEDPARGKLLSTYVNERWTSIAVDPRAGPQQNWTVYFVGTSNGDLLRFLSPFGDLKTGVFLSRQSIFDEERCNSSTASEDDRRIIRVITDSTRDNVAVVFKNCIRTIPLRACSIHKCKESCLASADPYCGWDGVDCVAYVAPEVNVEQYVYANAMQPASESENSCPTSVVIPVIKETLPTESESGPGEEASQNGDEEDGDKSDAENGTSDTEGGEEPEKDENDVTIAKFDYIGEDSGYLHWKYIVIIGVACLVMGVIFGIVIHKCCCPNGSCKDEEKQVTGLGESRASIMNPESICKKARKTFKAISPGRKRKENLGGSVNCSNSTLAQEETVSPLIKTNNKYDECRDVPDGKDNRRPPSYSTMPRNTSVASQSQIVMGGNHSLPSGKPRRASHSVQSNSVSSLKGNPPQYATAPRPRHYSGNRSSDPGARMVVLPDNYTSAPTMRADKRPHPSGHIPTRHSTPMSFHPVPPSPCRSDAAFSFHSQASDEVNNVVNNTEDCLRGVAQLIAQEEQRKSLEMDTLHEEPDERPRHDSDDSGKGPSPRDSLQNEEERDSTISTLPRPRELDFGNRPRRQRLNSEPTSPTYNDNAPMPVAIGRKPVARSVSVRSAQIPPQHHPSQYAPQRSGSFSYHSQPSTPVDPQNSPPRMGMMQQINQGPPHNYSTLPTKPSVPSNRRGKMDQFSMQQPYETHSPYQNRQYQGYDTSTLTQGQQQVMMMPDKYSSLPARGQGHRSKKSQMHQAPQFILDQPPNKHRHSNPGNMPHPHVLKTQWSSPAFPTTSQRPRYVPTPTVPGTCGPVQEVNEV